VNPKNRQRSVLIPKSFLKYSPNLDQNQAYVFDNQKQMLEIVAGLKNTGQISQISGLIDGTLPYNNSNGKISPGEIIGISLNLYNSSNSIMGGVQVLGNDWDHGQINRTTGFLEPCNNFEDEFPLANEGAAPLSATTAIPGDCQYITRTNGGDKDQATNRAEVLAPICYVQYRDENQTLWLGQDQFRSKMEIENKDCLIDRTSTTSVTPQNKNHDCFIRVIPGAEQSHFSKIDPQKTFAQTLGGTGSFDFSAPHLILFEVSPFIPPGTTFDCRFRARFTNCEDCWHDVDQNGDDYLDYEYSGGEPFKILHLQFTVID
jgi:hypothetical protein